MLPERFMSRLFLYGGHNAAQRGHKEFRLRAQGSRGGACSGAPPALTGLIARSPRYSLAILPAGTRTRRSSG